MELKPAPWIISCTGKGYKLPFHSIPDPICKPNQQSALSNPQFVVEALAELECNRCIQKIEHQQSISSPLSIVDNGSGKLHLVINLHYLNQFLWVDKFKYKDLHISMLMSRKETFLLYFDLKLGYHHIDIYKPHRQFLGFQWEAESGFISSVVPG